MQGALRISPSEPGAECPGLCSLLDPPRLLHRCGRLHPFPALAMEKNALQITAQPLPTRGSIPLPRGRGSPRGLSPSSSSSCPAGEARAASAGPAAAPGRGDGCSLQNACSGRHQGAACSAFVPAAGNPAAVPRSHSTRPTVSKVPSIASRSLENCCSSSSSPLPVFCFFFFHRRDFLQQSVCLGEELAHPYSACTGQEPSEGSSAL